LGSWNSVLQATSATGCRGDQLELEEFYLVLTQIEACLNSCPITVLSSVPNDIQTLTPGYFFDCSTSEFYPRIHPVFWKCNVIY
jgi:hypothetical protein